MFPFLFSLYLSDMDLFLQLVDRDFQLFTFLCSGSSLFTESAEYIPFPLNTLSEYAKKMINLTFCIHLSHNNYTCDLVGFVKLLLISYPYIYSRHHDLVIRYGISVSKMTTDMFHLS